MKSFIQPFLFGGLLLPAVVVASDSLEEITVISSGTEMSMREVGAAVTVIDEQEIQLRGYSSMVDLLRTQPGITVSNSGGAGKVTTLRIRGEEGFRTLVLIDGVDVSDPTGPQVSPQTQHFGMTSDIERVEILRGPQGLIYGADAGGVINILTRSSGDDAFGLSVEKGADDSRKLQSYVAAEKDELSVFVSASRQQTDGFNTLVSDTELADNDGYENTTLHGKFGLKINANWQAQLVARDTQAESEYDACYFTSPEGAFQKINQCLSNYDQRIVKLSFLNQGDKFKQRFSTSRSHVDNQSWSNQQLSNASNGTIKKMDYVGELTVNSWLNWQGGVDYKNESMESVYSNLSDRRQIGVFQEAQLHFDERWFVSAGLRHDDHQVFGGHLSKRISAANIQPLNDGDEIKIRFSWGTGFRAPSLYEAHTNATSFTPMPLLNEERSEGGDIGIEYHKANGAVLALGLFDQSITNEIFYDMVNYSGYLQENGISHSQGLELGVRYPFISWLELAVNYTFNDTLSAADKQRVRRPKNSMNVAFSGQVINDKIKYLLNIRSAQDAVDLGQVKLDDYVVADLNIQYQWLESLKINLRGSNILDKEYTEVTGYNTPGRQLFVGVQYDL